jgi:CDP-diacylglycerol--glycerol-3-phosphate 3-phosphatidyltransferase
VQRDVSQQPARIVTLANVITLLRILCIPVFVGLLVRHRLTFHVTPDVPQLAWYRHAALGVFVLASVSDALDGWLARRFGQRSLVGAWLDPLADKLLLTTAVLTLSLPVGLPERLPFWFPIVTLTRDFIILAGAIIIFMLRGHVEVRPSLAGKLTTCAQMACVILTLLVAPWPVLLGALIVATALTGVSGAQYIARGYRQVHA